MAADAAAGGAAMVMVAPTLLGVGAWRMNDHGSATGRAACRSPDARAAAQRRLPEVPPTLARAPRSVFSRTGIHLHSSPLVSRRSCLLTRRPRCNCTTSAQPAREAATRPAHSGAPPNALPPLSAPLPDTEPPRWFATTPRTRNGATSTARRRQGSLPSSHRAGSNDTTRRDPGSGSPQAGVGRRSNDSRGVRSRQGPDASSHLDPCRARLARPAPVQTPVRALSRRDQPFSCSWPNQLSPKWPATAGARSVTGLAALVA